MILFGDFSFRVDLRTRRIILGPNRILMGACIFVRGFPPPAPVGSNFLVPTKYHGTVVALSS